MNYQALLRYCFHISQLQHCELVPGKGFIQYVSRLRPDTGHWLFVQLTQDGGLARLCDQPVLYPSQHFISNTQFLAPFNALSQYLIEAIALSDSSHV